MKTSRKRIGELLDRIEERYPESRIAPSKQKWNDLWTVDRPFRTPPVVLHRGRIMDGKRHPEHHTVESRTATLIQQLEDIVRMSDIQDDYLPVIDLDTGAYILAEAFGGERVVTGGLYLIHPFLKTEADVEALRRFDPDAENHYINMVFETQKFFVEETAGRIPINIHTPQGPLETLGCMWDSLGFYTALLESPDVVKTALDKIVDGYIYYIRRQMDIIGRDSVQFNFAMSYCHRPPGTGIGVGEDVIATIGPGTFALTLPIYARIAREFGPLLLHSCGHPAHQTETVMAAKEIAGIQFSQLAPEAFIPKLSRPIVVQSRNDWESCEQFEHYARLAKETHQRIAYQVQSLADWMQVGEDLTQYDPVRMNEMFLKISDILNRIYGA